jgi:hypothetical protein
MNKNYFKFTTYNELGEPLKEYVVYYKHPQCHDPSVTTAFYQVHVSDFRLEKRHYDNTRVVFKKKMLNKQQIQSLVRKHDVSKDVKKQIEANKITWY